MFSWGKFEFQAEDAARRVLFDGKPTAEAVVRDALAPDRYRAVWAIIVAAAAALIAATGTAPVVIRDVTRRLKEFAIRKALGAAAL